jgi:2-polyprenyl-3-methyl-5-hydroxy-6-metoxy-1,4-benzoquinol methylase
MMEATRTADRSAPAAGAPLELETLTSCNLCGGKDFETYVQKRGLMTSHVFSIVRCRTCGLLFVTPRLTAEGNARLYDEGYFNGHGFDASMNYVGLEAKHDSKRAGENRGIIDKIRLLRPGLEARVLDVGCGTGSLLRALEAAGYKDVWGLELSEYGAGVARASLGHARVVVGDIIDADFGDVRFDAINATEVLEHTRDPLAFFKKVHALLKPGGVFVYSTGNAQGIYARVLGKRWPYLIPEGHLVYYTPSTMARYIERAGLDVLRDSDIPGGERGALLRFDDDITYSQLMYLGESDAGMKGRIFRFAAAMTGRGLKRLVTVVVGKHALPIAIKRA